MELIKLYIFSKKLAVIIISGETERQILKNINNIIKTALPLNKVSGYYKDSKDGGWEEVMEYLVFFQQRKEVSAYCWFYAVF